MKVSFVIVSFLLISLTGCGPSEESRKEAYDVYNKTIGIVNQVNLADSNYAACMQYLLREIQAPGLKKDKKKIRIIRDSIHVLDVLSDSLQWSIESATGQLSDLRKASKSFDMFSSADTLMHYYTKISEQVYPKLNAQMKEISLPVKDAEYTIVLQLTFEADSVLNDAVKKFNAESATFYEEYSLKEFKE